MPTMDWKKETKNNPVYPVGTYHVKLEGYERCTSKPTSNNPQGAPQIRWKAAILNPEEHEGRTFFVHTALTAAALWRTANVVSGFGVRVDGAMDTSSHAFDLVCTSCIGRTAYWRNAVGEYNGTPTNNVVEFTVDPNQDEVEFDPLSDVPDFAK